MPSDSSKRMQAERVARSQFVEGGFVAVVNHHWDRRIVGRRKICRVYKNGNFTITAGPSGEPDVQQYRPNSDGTLAHQTGSLRFRSSDHLEPWSPAIEAEIVERAARHARLGRVDAVIAKLKALGANADHHSLRAIEAALGLLTDWPPTNPRGCAGG